jgi:hypothetical protein
MNQFSIELSLNAKNPAAPLSDGAPEDRAENRAAVFGSERGKRALRKERELRRQRSGQRRARREEVVHDTAASSKSSSDTRKPVPSTIREKRRFTSRLVPGDTWDVIPRSPEGSLDHGRPPYIRTGSFFHAPPQFNGLLKRRIELRTTAPMRSKSGGLTGRAPIRSRSRRRRRPSPEGRKLRTESSRIPQTSRNRRTKSAERVRPAPVYGLSSCPPPNPRRSLCGMHASSPRIQVRNGDSQFINTPVGSPGDLRPTDRTTIKSK